MVNSLKKVFSSFVTLLTVAWSVGVGTFALPSVASAAAMPGDLIKASGPAVYYYASNGKRYVFPNQTTYMSWYADFSSVKTISDAELAAIGIGGNVTIRPGTKLIKITTDPKVYAVTAGGVLHWVETEAVAVALFGANWASRVVDVADGFFVNYTVGSSIASAVHPDGTLVQYAGSSDVYVVWGGQKRLLAAGAFAANGFNAANVIMTSVSYPNGTTVAGRESALADVVSGAGVVTPVGAISVALASDTPAGMTLPKNANGTPVAKFNLMAGSSDVTVTGLRVRRVGVGAASDVANIYLYDGAGTRLTTGRTINASTNLVEFNGLNIVVPAGQTRAVVVTLDLAGSSITTTGGQHAFELSDASAVVAGSSAVSGSFPARGSMFTVGSADAASVTVQPNSTPSNPTVGSKQAELANFKLVVGTNDVKLNRITLYQGGTISNSDLSNLNLYQGATLLATAATMTGDKAVFNLATPFLIQNGNTKVFNVKADVAGRSGRSIRFYVEFASDVSATDQVYGSGAAVTIDDYDGGSTGTSQATYTETQGGQLTVATGVLPAQNIGINMQDVPLFKFSLSSQENQLEIRKFYVTVSSTNGGYVTEGGTNYFKDIKIKNASTGATVWGPKEITGSTAGTVSLTFNDNSLYLQPGQTVDLVLTADTANTSDSDFVNKGFVAKIGGASNMFASTDVRVVDTGEYLAASKIVPNSQITGNTMTVKSSSLTVSLASSPSSNSVVKKQGSIPSVGIVFAAGAQSGARLTALTVRGSSSDDGSTYSYADLANTITSCGLYDGTKMLGQKQNPDTTAGTLNFTNLNLSVAAGTSKTLTVNCDIASTVTSTKYFALGVTSSGVTAEDDNSNTISVTPDTALTNNGTATAGGLSVKLTVRTTGTLTIAADDMRQSTILVAGGETWHNLAQFKASAQYEAISLDRVMVTSTGDAALYSMIGVAVDGALKASDSLPAGSASFRDLDLSANPIVVPKDGSVTFQLWGKLNNVQSSSSVSGVTSGVVRSGATTTLGIAAGNTTASEYDATYSGKFNVRATGMASGERLKATGSTTYGNNFFVRKTKPVVTRQTLSGNLGTSVLGSGNDQNLYAVQIGADNAGSVAIKKLTFTYSKSSSTGFTVSNLRLRKGYTDITSNITIVDENGTDLYAGSIGAASTTGKVVVYFSGSTQESVSGTGTLYTLHGTIGTVVSGNTLSVSMYRPASSNNTAYLASTTVTIPGPNLDVAGDTTAEIQGGFIWSDNSELPHNATIGSGSSPDWTNEYLVEDMTQTQTLSL